MSDPDKMLAYMPRERYEYLKRYKELIKDKREDCLNMNNLHQLQLELHNHNSIVYTPINHNHKS